MLVTTTALGTSPQAYRILRRLVLHLTIILTILATAIAFVGPRHNYLPYLTGVTPELTHVIIAVLQRV